MDKHKIINKILKCLRLSESGNANEAALALRQAKALMRKHEIREEEVSRQVQEASSDSGGYYNPPYWAVALSELVAMAFDCRAYVSRPTSGERAYFRFIGVNYAATIAAYTYTFLFRQLRASRRDYLQQLAIDDKAERVRRANVFAQAWLFSIAKTVAEFVPNCENQSMIEDYVRERYGETADFKRAPADTASEDYDVIMSGMRAAKTVQLFRPVHQSRETKGLLGECA